MVNPHRGDLDVSRLHRPLDESGMTSGETSVSLFFYPSQRPSGAWALRKVEAGPLQAYRYKAGAWEWNHSYLFRVGASGCGLC